MLAFLIIFLKNIYREQCSAWQPFCVRAWYFFLLFFRFLFVQIWRYLVVVLHLIYLRYWTTEKYFIFSSFIFRVCVLHDTQSIYPSIFHGPFYVVNFSYFSWHHLQVIFYTFFSQHNLWIILIYMYTFMFSCILLDLNV